MWKIEYTKRFLKELAKLPREIQEKSEKIVFEDLIRNNPFDLGYIEQMAGYSDKYKIRIGKYIILNLPPGQVGSEETNQGVRFARYPCR